MHPCESKEKNPYWGRGKFTPVVSTCQCPMKVIKNTEYASIQKSRNLILNFILLGWRFMFTPKVYFENDLKTNWAVKIKTVEKMLSESFKIYHKLFGNK